MGKQKEKKYSLTIIVDFLDTTKYPRETQKIDGEFELSEARAYGIRQMKYIMEEDKHFLKDRGDTASLYPYRVISAVHMSVKEIDEDVHTGQGEEKF